MNPKAFDLAINCRDEGVLCKGEENPLVRASGFPLPLRSPSFPQRCSGASPRDPQSLVLAKGFCSLEQKVFARSSKRSLHARAEGLCSLEQRVFTRLIEGSSLERNKVSLSFGIRCLFRAGRDPRPERDATLIPSETRPLSRADRDVPLARREAFPSLEGRGSLGTLSKGTFFL